MKKIFIILICLLVASPAFAKSPLDKLLKYFKNGEVIKIQSYNAKNFIEIKDGTYKKSPIEIDAFISYPKKGDGPFPVLVFVHSSGGPLLFTDEWFKFNRQVAKLLQKKGVAVMFLDNFVPRGTYTTYANQQKVTHWSTYIDAFKALEYLSKQPKVNIKKIGITGWSRGGMISLMVSEKRLRDILVSKDLYFAVAQPRSPDCTTNMFRNPQPIKETKTWMVLGEADDYTLAEDCVEQGKRIKAKGPFSADTFFTKHNLTKYDVAIGMYHDQVLTPFKALFKYDAINVTLGLPFIRVSPDHGPNEKMISKNISDPTSIIQSILFFERSL